MNDLWIHFLLFAAIALAITAVSGAYAESDDSKLLRSLPRRFLVFCFGCGVVATLLLIFEHTVASVD